jgi:AcrR family transcriptional regulator
MTPTTTTPVVPERAQRADARRNREAILAAAKEVFGAAGDEAQMDDIARAAGVGVGTVYRHFPTKDALIGELVRLKFVDMADRARRWLNEEPDPWKCFEGFVTECAEKMASDRAQQQMMWLTSPEAFQLAREAQQDLAAVGQMIITRAQKAGALRKDWSSDDMRTLMCALTASMQMTGRTPPGAPLDHDWRKLLAVAFDGLRAK